jgi:hypothetical protein
MSASVQSNWTVVRGSAAMFAANLLAASPAPVRQRLHVNSIVTGGHAVPCRALRSSRGLGRAAALIKLLTESSASVRSKTAKALSLLHQL